MEGGYENQHSERKKEKKRRAREKTGHGEGDNECAEFLQQQGLKKRSEAVKKTETQEQGSVMRRV